MSDKQILALATQSGHTVFAYTTDAEVARQRASDDPWIHAVSEQGIPRRFNTEYVCEIITPRVIPADAQSALDND